MNIYGTSGTDFLYGTASMDMIVGFGGTDYLYGGEGEDLLIGGDGPDVLFGDTAYTHGTELDMAAYWDSPTGVHVNLWLGRGFFGTAEGDRLIDIEGVRGSVYGDTLIGNRTVNNLDGGSGNDWLVGLQGNDDLTGGFGDDTLFGGSEADILNGGPDNDTADYYSYYTATVGVWASLLFGGVTGEAAGDTYMSIENLTGSYYGDLLQGDNNANHLRGENGSDWLWGEGGNDRLDGGYGIDMLVGGAGADTFVWRYIHDFYDFGMMLTSAEVIGDFDPASDLIDLQQFDADETIDGEQAFAFIGMDAFTAPGQVRWSIEGSETVVWLNIDSDLAAEASIRLAGAPLIGESHFLL